jgi:hypothetical protein
MTACGPPSGGGLCAKYCRVGLVRHEILCFIFIFLSQLAFIHTLVLYTQLLTFHPCPVRVCPSRFSCGLVEAVFAYD